MSLKAWILDGTAVPDGDAMLSGPRWIRRDSTSNSTRKTPVTHKNDTAVHAPV